MNQPANSDSMMTMKPVSHASIPEAGAADRPLRDRVSRRSLLGWLAAPAAGWWLSGCAGTPRSGAQGGQEVLLQRARAYWAAMVANDLVTAWGYEDISRDPNWTLQAYLKRASIAYRAAEVQAVHRLEGDRAELTVRLRYDVPIARLRDIQADVIDHWRLIDGQWYHAKRGDSRPAS